MVPDSNIVAERLVTRYQVPFRSSDSPRLHGGSSCRPCGVQARIRIGEVEWREWRTSSTEIVVGTEGWSISDIREPRCLRVASNCCGVSSFGALG